MAIELPVHKVPWTHNLFEYKGLGRVSLV